MQAPWDIIIKAVFPERLRKVYKDYIDSKQKIASSQKWGMALRMVIPQIFSQTLIPLIDFGTDVNPNFIALIVGVLVTVIITAISDKSSKKIEEITDDFKLKYTCGNILKSGKECGQFLGFDSPRIWESRGCTCPKCHQVII